MKDNKIKFTTNESDDWSILQCGDFKTCNHQISKEEFDKLSELMLKWASKWIQRCKKAEYC